MLGKFPVLPIRAELYILLIADISYLHLYLYDVLSQFLKFIDLIYLKGREMRETEAKCQRVLPPHEWPAKPGAKNSS